MLTRNLDTEESRKFWKFVEETSKEVQSWPIWMRVLAGALTEDELRELENWRVRSRASK